MSKAPSSPGERDIYRWRQTQQQPQSPHQTQPRATTTYDNNHQQSYYQYRPQSTPSAQQQQQHHSTSPYSSITTTSPLEFAMLPPKSTRQLSLQTYLATYPEWSSATRLVSLYSEFEKLKETNPYGYEANVNWWRTVIMGASRNGLLSMYRPCSPPMSPSTSPAASITGSSTTGVTEQIFEPTGTAIGILELDLDHLSYKFLKNGSRPHSLAAVLSEMTQMGDVVPRSEFLPWAGVGWKGWIFHKVVKAPLLWSLKQLSLSDSTPSSPSYAASPTLASTGIAQMGSPNSGSSSVMKGSGGLGASSISSNSGLGSSASSGSSGTPRDTYVVLPFVQEAAVRILKLQQDSTSYRASDNLMTFAEFREKFSRTALLPIRGKLVNDGSMIILTDRDLEILIRYLQHEMKVLVTGKLDASKYDNELQDNELVIKFATKDAIRDKSRQEVTQADRGIIELRETCKRLDKQVQDLEQNIAELTEKARACVRRNQRLQATYALKRRKNLEDVLNKRIKSLETISSILFRIQSSETDAEILQSYKLGANTLATVMSTRGEDGTELLSKDSVESTMDRLADVFADQEEVDEALSLGTESLLESSLPGGAVDEDELMAELDALATESTTTTAKQVPNRARNTPPLANNGAAAASTTATDAKSSVGKRVADIPEEAAYVATKQRKVSQASIQPQRGNSTDSAASTSTTSAVTVPVPASGSVSGDEVSSSSSVSIPTSNSDRTAEVAELHQMIVDTHEHVPTAVETPQSSVAMEGLVTPAASTSSASLSPLQTPSQEVEGLSSQEERDLQDMLAELEDIHAPEDSITELESKESEEGSTSSKPRKESRMMEA
ncbi:hypothetical protein BGZ83_006079 [Gryganskiella cystojenkinii]|nr:hypothetical protein BGZ83_006079 [Gryganskiella cystojenkinii]